MSSSIFSRSKNDKAIGIWLLWVAFLVFVIIIVGGATRLTGSGLSMVNWQPISGIFPPFSQEAWFLEFEAYKQYPEYIKVNIGMSLDDFKSIFWWEYYHRLLGRFIGLFFVVGLIYFLKKRMVRPKLKITLFFLLALGGSQGLLGWYMVQSGLVNEPDVSHYRLAAHLGLALFIIITLVWVGLNLLRPSYREGDKNIFRLAIFAIFLVFLQSILGAFVAGLKAGKIYNSWPDMNGDFLPEGAMSMVPWWVNFLDNNILVQFDHRIVGYLIVFLAIYIFVISKMNLVSMSVRRASKIFMHTSLLQMTLGILTLIMVVPIWLGVIHQGVAVILLLSSLNLAHRATGRF
ncbi:MAG: COX15/CtaA family protein [Sphingomonadales bacterium]